MGDLILYFITTKPHSVWIQGNLSGQIHCIASTNRLTISTNCFRCCFRLNRLHIQTKAAPEAIGTYSQAIRAGDTVYLSGQIPLDPNTMGLCSDKIEDQITHVISNLSAVCTAASGSL